MTDLKLFHDICRYQENSSVLAEGAASAKAEEGRGSITPWPGSQHIAGHSLPQAPHT